VSDSPTFLLGHSSCSVRSFRLFAQTATPVARNPPHRRQSRRGRMFEGKRTAKFRRNTIVGGAETWTKSCRFPAGIIMRRKESTGMLTGLARKGGGIGDGAGLAAASISRRRTGLSPGIGVEIRRVSLGSAVWRTP